MPEKLQNGHQQYNAETRGQVMYDCSIREKKDYNSQQSQRRKAGNDNGRISLLVKTHNDGIRSAKLRKSQQNQEGVGKRSSKQQAVKPVEQTAVPGKTSARKSTR